MQKIELICSLSSIQNIGGETIKNDYLYEYLGEKNFDVNLLNFENYRDNKFILLLKCIYSIINPFSKKIIFFACSFKSQAKM